MPKDYVHRAHGNSRNWRKPVSKKSPEKPKKHFPWFFIFSVLIVIGLGIAGGLYFYSQLKDKIEAPTVDQPTTIVKKAAPQKVAKEEAPPVHFDFYSMLPKNTVNVATDAAVSADKKTKYILQVASLSDPNDVKAFETKLNEVGFHSKVVPMMRGQMEWYRVQVGPFNERSDAEVARDTLSQQDISSVLLEIDRK
jgi:cell division protein FtsN